MRYIGNVIRPPSEADSLVVQVTTGCSHNNCRFCGAYPQPFSVKNLADVEDDLDFFLMQNGPGVRRLFLADGNALVRKTSDLLVIIDKAKDRFPRLSRVGAYANARDVAAKSDEELVRLSRAGLKTVYIGLESGDNDVLKAMNKEASAEQTVEAVQRLQAAGIKASVMALLGLAGDNEKASRKHAGLTARAVSAMQPRYFSVLTVMLIPGTPLFDDAAAGGFSLPSCNRLLDELEIMIAGLELKRTVFRSNHASNYLPLAGTLSRDKDKLLRTIRLAKTGQQMLRPEFLRGL